ncbi:MAG: GTPase HflX [Planctomycetes bacterium]|nr:GTPase HflX [Planctomycetota bacterium]
MKSQRLMTVYRERAILVGTISPRHFGRDSTYVSPKDHQEDDPLAELEQLAITAGAIVVEKITQKKQKPDVAYYIGRGKVSELKELADKNDIDTVIFDNDLSPGQIRNLENELKIKVLDRTELILDIFVTHARSLQAKLQVELAQLEYTLPRLTHLWSHLSKIEGGVGIGQRGPGEKQLEMDRRIARDRITKLKREIEDINQHHKRTTENRSSYFNIALLGYTNAGKSALMNALTGTDCLVENKLFSTLDTKTQLWNPANHYKVLLSDTVGFIRNLPHHLVASFNATLQEVIDADLLLHIVDVFQPGIDQRIQAVDKVLEELGCSQKPRLLVFNKIDKIDPLEMQIVSKEFPDSVFISAKNKQGLDALAGRIVEFIAKDETLSTFSVSAGDGKFLSYLEEMGNIISKTYRDGMVRIKIRLSPHAKAKVMGYLEANKNKAK